MVLGRGISFFYTRSVKKQQKAGFSFLESRSIAGIFNLIFMFLCGVTEKK
jgi:hypothetical protein